MKRKKSQITTPSVRCGMERQIGHNESDAFTFTSMWLFCILPLLMRCSHSFWNQHLSSFMLSEISLSQFWAVEISCKRKQESYPRSGLCLLTTSLSVRALTKDQRNMPYGLLRRQRRKKVVRCSMLRRVLGRTKILNCLWIRRSVNHLSDYMGWGHTRTHTYTLRDKCGRSVLGRYFPTDIGKREVLFKPYPHPADFSDITCQFSYPRIASLHG